MEEAAPLDRPFDRGLRRRRRDRAARSPALRDWLAPRISEEILERLDFVRRDFARALVLGGGHCGIAQKLAARGIRAIAADPGPVFAGTAGGVQCEEDLLPFADRSFDLIVSAGGLDTVNDLPGALALARRTLRPDGLFLAACWGAGSLPRLKGALLAAEEAEGRAHAPRIHPQIDVRAAGDLLARAGFALPVADAESVTVRYSGLPALVADLRAMAATNMLALRDPRPLGRIGYAAACAAFAAAADPDGKTGERFEILHLSGWAPDPSQPRAAARGSGAVSLAAMLGRKD
jgi:NADH dehydrogenase [ubiquinone] 1 alpha subcomplex assembly factor 5